MNDQLYFLGVLYLSNSMHTECWAGTAVIVTSADVHYVLSSDGESYVTVSQVYSIPTVRGNIHKTSIFYLNTANT